MDMPELVLVNGAGLSRDTRISARSMAKLLMAAHAEPVRGGADRVDAACPPMDGTLRQALHRRGHGRTDLHLKTGRLDDVSGSPATCWRRTASATCW